MLSLKNITKKYFMGDSEIDALKGVSIDFRRNEFVSILGPSGCGKTTLLNIIGGLDSYTGGDLAILGRSTKSYNAGDWDSYRNHSIGFVFQSYNLIPHQSILSNVELALTLSGVSKSERKSRATEALTKVGLGDELKKRPNQLSGGQMQRVAIARALVNDPEILLADEPTGALDSETSVQIMELLKEIAKDKLVIMVTHNPELADKYSTRIIRLLDGRIVNDTMPYVDETVPAKKNEKKKQRDYDKTSMSLFTALSLSMNNLLTKKARTLLISFAGSIGIIGIALILSLSNGIQIFIDTVQKDTLSSYPIQIQTEAMDMSSLLTAMSEDSEDNNKGEREDGRVYQNMVLYKMMNALNTSSTTKNNLEPFKKHLEEESTGLEQYISAISYGYDITPFVFVNKDSDAPERINPSPVIEKMYSMGQTTSQSTMPMMQAAGSYKIWEEMIPSPDGGAINQLLVDQYDVVYGNWPSAYNEIMIFIDSNNELNDMVLYSLGLMESEKFDELMSSVMSGEELSTDESSWSYEELCSLKFKLILPTDIFKQNDDGTWSDMSENSAYMSYVVNKGVDIKITGIARPNDSAVSTAMNGSVGYTKALTDHLIANSSKSKIIHQQNSNEIITEENNPYSNDELIGTKFSEVDVFTGLIFEEFIEDKEELTAAEKADHFKSYVDSLDTNGKAQIYLSVAKTPSEDYVENALQQYMTQLSSREAIEQNIMQYYSVEAGVSPDEIKEYLDTLTDAELKEMITKTLRDEIIKGYEKSIDATLSAMTQEDLSRSLDVVVASADENTLSDLYDKYMPLKYSKATYDENQQILSVVDVNKPSSVNIFATSFEAKEEISRIIAEYNEATENETDRITYTDYVAIMMSSVSTIINAISYVLIAFVAISLVVSSIMIGIITYISVLERTKEIGILRAIGASKRDISRVFNAEALILGFCSGLLGIIVTIILNLPINVIIRQLSGISGISAALPWVAGIALVVISMVLTFIAGLIPSRIAAKKDPVVALRTE